MDNKCCIGYQDNQCAQIGAEQNNAYVQIGGNQSNYNLTLAGDQCNGWAKIGGSQYNDCTKINGYQSNSCAQIEGDIFLTGVKILLGETDQRRSKRINDWIASNSDNDSGLTLSDIILRLIELEKLAEDLPRIDH